MNMKRERETMKCPLKSNDNDPSTHRNKVVLHIGPMKGILGIPDPEKVRGIVEDPMPQDQAQLRSFRGSITYLTQYVPNLAIVIASLRKLTQKGVPWKWTTAETVAYE